MKEAKNPKVPGGAEEQNPGVANISYGASQEYEQCEGNTCNGGHKGWQRYHQIPKRSQIHATPD